MAAKLKDSRSSDKRKKKLEIKGKDANDRGKKECAKAIQSGLHVQVEITH